MISGLSSGSLLVSSTHLRDGVFYRSVVLIAECNSKGSWGVILNRRTTINPTDLLVSTRLSDVATGSLRYGGPVAEDSAVAIGVLHRGLTAPQGVHVLRGDIAIVDLDTSWPSVANQVRGVAVFGGYSGWDAGQLERELDEGAWHIATSLPSDVLHDDEDLWSTVLRRQPEPLSWYATYPDDVYAN